MSEFGILDSSYRLIETRFLDDWVVFKAVEVETERTVQIRTPNDRLLADPQRFEAFQRAAGRLSHNVSVAPRYHPPGAFDERGYLVTTWTDLTLDSLLREQDVLTPERSFQLLELCLVSLGEIAAVGFSHGRLTPEDLGIAKDEVIIDTMRIDTTAETLALQAYVAPEVVRDGGQVGPGSDIYTLGMIAYRMLLGRDRFERTLEHHEHEAVPGALSDLRPDIPAAVCHVIERMVVADPGERFSSATMAHQALEEALDVSNLERPGDPVQSETAKPKHDAAREPAAKAVEKEFAPSHSRLAPPTELSAPERSRQSRTAVPAFLTVAVLLVIIGGGWYAWQFVYEKQHADTVMTDVISMRDAAQTARANIHALDAFARAEQKLGEAQEAYESHRFSRAAGLAGEASMDYAKARDTALERGAYEALEKASAVYESAVAVEGINTTALNVQLAALRAAELSLETGDYLGATGELTEIEHLIATLLTEAGARALDRKIAELGVEVLAQTPDNDNIGILEVKERLQAARTALSTGDQNAAMSHYEEAQTLFERSIDQSRWQQIERIKRETQQTRRAVIAAGAERSSRFAEAELKWQIALDAWQDRDDAEGERALRSARSFYESLLEEQRATQARDGARQERDRITDLDNLPPESELASGDAQLALGDSQMENEDFSAAGVTFSKAGTIFREVSAHTQRNQVERLSADTSDAGEKAKASGAEKSTLYQKALTGLRRAEALIENGEHQAARVLLEPAKHNFVQSELAARADAAAHSMSQARDTAIANGLTLESPGFSLAESLSSEGRAAIVSESYDLAIERFTQATTAMERSTQDVLRPRAEGAKKRALEALGEIGGQVDDSEPELIEAKERLSRAQAAYDTADYRPSMVRFDEATALLEGLRVKLAASAAERNMKDALARAVTAGITGELGELSVGLSHRTTGEQRQSEKKFDEARIAFELAVKAFEQAVMVEMEIRALRARDATAAVRKSAASSGAAPMERFSQANELFDQATADLARGDHASAYEMFRHSQNGFDQAAMEWAAQQAGESASAAMEQARIAGVSASDPSMVGATNSIGRAEQLLSRNAFGEAAKLLVTARQVLETLVEDLETSGVESARAAALDAKAGIPAGYQTARLDLGERAYVNATEAMSVGELTLALSRFNVATDHFEVALIETRAMQGQTMTASARAAVKSMGARDTDILFVQGKEREQAGIEHLAVLRFSEARQMFDRARESFDDLQQYLKQQTKQFVTGSTADEMTLAIELCRSHATDCATASYEDERERDVSLRPFAIDDHEVTNEEFDEFVRTEGYETEAERLGYSMRAAGRSSVQAPGHSWRRPGGRGTNYLRYPNHPVVHVSHADASAYCHWSGGRLPEEAEWEYAARGAERRQFPWGHDWQAGLIRWGGEPSAGPMPVRAFPASSTPNGMHDMAGNVPGHGLMAG